MKKKFRIAGAGLIVLMIAAVMISWWRSAVSINKGVALTDEETQVTAGGWMGQLVADDCPINTVNLPGTHDSATKFVQLSYFSKCQNGTVLEQLAAGYRYLDVRLGIEQADDGSRLKLMHGFTSCKEGFFPWSPKLYFDSVLAECYAFLDEHPTETVILCVKQEHGDESVSEFQAAMKSYIGKNPDYWYLEDRIPAMGEVRGKLVLARRYADEAEYADAAGLGLVWIDQPGSEVAQQTYEDNSKPNNLGLWVQDRYEYGTEDKWDAICALYGDPPYAKDASAAGQYGKADTVCLTFLSTKGTMKYGHPYTYAKEINRRFLEQEMENGADYGWVIMDYGTNELAKKVYLTNR